MNASKKGAQGKRIYDLLLFSALVPYNSKYQEYKTVY